MIKPFKVALIILFFIFLLSPSLLFAGEELYDKPGFDPNRMTESVGDFEHIDPFTGGLTLSFKDVVIPGNGGLDLVVQRTYNSKNVCKTWLNFLGTSCPEIGEDSWAGLGWTLHYGKLQVPNPITPNNLNPIIEIPDGSIHEAYNIPGSSVSFITKDYWILETNVTPNVHVLKLTDGTKIYFEKQTKFVGLYDEYFATRIVDVHDNTITINHHPNSQENDPYYGERPKGSRGPKGSAEGASP